MESGWAKGSYERARGNEDAKSDPFAIHIEEDPTYKSLYADAESVDGYYRDQNVRPALFVLIPISTQNRV